jgi:YbbR domain-containing protein
MIILFQELILKDFWLKLFSLVLAVLIWLTITFAIHRDLPPAGAALPAHKDLRTLYNLPVAILSAGTDVRNFSVTPAEVQVTLQGEPALLQSLQPRDVHILVDVTGVQAGGDLLKQIEVSTPPGITYTHVSPQAVRIVFPGKN